VRTRKHRKFSLNPTKRQTLELNQTSNKERFRMKTTRKSRGFSLTWLLIVLLLLLIGVYILETI
jgi:hypothetical protein